MPLHERQQLREAAIAALTGATAAGSRVNKSRMPPARDAELPLISVYSVDEPVRETSAKTSPRVLTRDPKIVVVGWVRASTDVDDVADALALEIETAMDADPHFDSCAVDSVLEGTQIEILLEGERPLAAISLFYAMTYDTSRRISLPTDRFDTAAAQVSLAGDQATLDQRAVLEDGIHG